MRSDVTLLMSGQRTDSQKGTGALHEALGRQVISGAPIKALEFWQLKCTLEPILVLRLEAASPLRSGSGGQWTGCTMISTLWLCRVGVVQVKMPESSFCA